VREWERDCKCSCCAVYKLGVVFTVQIINISEALLLPRWFSIFHKQPHTHTNKGNQSSDFDVNAHEISHEILIASHANSAAIIMVKKGVKLISSRSNSWVKDFDFCLKLQKGCNFFQNLNRIKLVDNLLNSFELLNKIVKSY
jgi:hypothetical protein